MKSYQVTIHTFLLFLFLSTISLFAQDNMPENELFYVHEDIIKIDKVHQYEDNVKKELELWKKHGMQMTVSHASKFDNNKYYFLTPLKSYADIDKQNEYWKEFSEKAGKETVEKLYDGYNDVYVSHRNFTLKRSSELSYWPENSNNNEEIKFLHFDHYYFKEGKYGEGLKLMKEYKELMKSKDSKEGYTVWLSDIGGEIGWVVVVTAAKSNVDYYTQTNERMKKLKENLKEMWPKFSQTLKNFDHNNGKPMPEFVYNPGK